MLYTLGDTQPILPTLSIPHLYKFNTAQRLGKPKQHFHWATRIFHWQAFKLKMEHFIRTAFWIVILSGCLQAKHIPIEDFNIELMRKHVTCVSNFKPIFFFTINLQSFCPLLNRQMFPFVQTASRFKILHSNKCEGKCLFLHREVLDLQLMVVIMMSLKWIISHDRNKSHAEYSPASKKLKLQGLVELL